MVEAGFKGIRTYVTRRQNKVAHYIEMRKILDLCERSAQRLAAWVSRRWQKQDGLDLEGTKERAAAESDGEEAISEAEGNAHGKDDRPGMREGVKSSNLTY